MIKVEELNEKQKELIDELDRNILLIAPAGTGKTETMSKRISNIIKNNRAKSNEILCITFTNKACKEMKERIEKAVSKDSKDITVKTFHSFCLEIIKDNAKKVTDIFTDFTIIDEEDSKDIIKEINKEFDTKKMFEFISFAKEYGLKLNHIENKSDKEIDYKTIIDSLFKEKCEIIENICSEKDNYCGKVLNEKFFYNLKKYGFILVNKYNNELRKNHMLDFNDLIIEVAKLFKDENIVERYKKKYKYINIDEVQDTNIEEYNIIEKIFGENNILLCGDTFQTIYEWRGSTPNEIQNKFEKKYNPKIIQFSKNYRATKTLVKASIEYLKNVFPKQYNEIYKSDIEVASSEEGAPIIYKSCKNRKEEAEFITQNIEKIYEETEEVQPKICILTRNNFLNIELSEELKKIDISSKKYDFVLVDQYKFFRRKEIKDIIAFLKLIVNKNDSVSFRRLLTQFSNKVKKDDIEDICSKESKKIGIKLSDFLKENLTKEYFTDLIESYDTNGNIVVFDVESTGVDVTTDEIIQIAAIKIDKEGNVIDSFNRFIKPNKSVGSSVLVHKFDDEYLKENGEDKERVLKEFLDYSKGSLIVGHNVNYDISILNSELERCKMDKPMFKGVYDTLDIYRRFYPNLPNHKLVNLSKIFHIEHKNAHNALSDVNATAYLLVHAIKNNIKTTSVDRTKMTEKYLNKFNPVSNFIKKLIKVSENMRPYEIVEYLLNNLNFKKIYGNEAKERIERINEFKEFLKDFDDKDKSNRDSLIDVLNLTSLSNGELEELLVKKKNKERIPIITVHQSKGLEFDYVFLAGLERGIFPSYQAINTNNLTEEERLFYVAITRAKKGLYLSNSKTNKWGRTITPSDFINKLNL